MAEFLLLSFLCLKSAPKNDAGIEKGVANVVMGMAHINRKSADFTKKGFADVVMVNR